MLPKAPIGPNAVRLRRVLDHHLGVDAVVPVGDGGGVVHEEASVNSDLGDVERVRTGEEAKPVDEPPEGAESTLEDVRAIRDLRC